MDPNVLILSNRTNEMGENIGLADGGSYFHSDYSYLSTPARCTILHAIEIPTGEAGTTFADQRAAYEALPQDERGVVSSSPRRIVVGGARDPHQTASFRD